MPMNGIIVTFILICLVPTFRNWRKTIFPVRFMLFITLLYLGGSSLASAHNVIGVEKTNSILKTAGDYILVQHHGGGGHHGGGAAMHSGGGIMHNGGSVMHKGGGIVCKIRLSAGRRDDPFRPRRRTGLGLDDAQQDVLECCLIHGSFAST